jgi:hypothetical protein
MKSFRQWLSAASWEANASIGGSFVSDSIEDYYLTPWDLGYGHLVKLPSWQYVHNVYGMFTNHFNRIASQVAEELLPKWRGRLAGVDFFLHNHAFVMLEALRVDWNAEPFVVLPPPALITEDS